MRSGRKAALEPNFSGTELAIGEALHIDVHSHIVPGVDDGSSTIEESLELIERLVNMGYRGAVVTPHIHSDIYPNNLLTLVPGAAAASGWCALAGIYAPVGRRVLPR